MWQFYHPPSVNNPSYVNSLVLKKYTTSIKIWILKVTIFNYGYAKPLVVMFPSQWELTESIMDFRLEILSLIMKYTCDVVLALLLNRYLFYSPKFHTVSWFQFHDLLKFFLQHGNFLIEALHSFVPRHRFCPDHKSIKPLLHTVIHSALQYTKGTSHYTFTITALVDNYFVGQSSHSLLKVLLQLLSRTVEKRSQDSHLKR